jgi:transcription initiation factor TFIIIB Brf1 subunit/transcription initiation factor TFIIB
MMDIDDIWAEAKLAQELSFPEEIKDSQEPEGCKHLNYEIDDKTSDKVCLDCGVVFCVNINSGADWNNYKDDCGNYSSSNQRADTYVDNNPYASSGCLIQFKGQPFLMRLQYQQMFSHKQKTFWQTSVLFERTGTLLNLKENCLDTAKTLWHKCMESGKLTRAAVRQGLIASCLYYSCIHNNVPIERDEILKVFECTSKCLSKGEKVMCQMLESFPEYHHLIYNNINIDENDSFVKYCSNLGLPFQVSTVCTDVFRKNKVKLQAVTPKSAIGGVITYTVKEKLKYKIPSKAQISKIVDVCTPTINKVVQILKS